MKILFIHPNRFAHRYVSVGISMISAVLKKAGHEVMFLDTSRYEQGREDVIDLSEKSSMKMKQVLQFLPVDLPEIEKSEESIADAIHRTIREFIPDLICFSVTSSEFTFMKELLLHTKQYDIPVIVGGAHPTVDPMETIQVEGVDMVSIGEGEEVILELVESLSKGEKRTDIKNVFFKVGDTIIENEIRPYIRDLDSLPFMDMDIFDKYHHVGAYQGKVMTYARVEAGRGCPYRCSYCINSLLHDVVYKNEKKHVRNKSPERVIKELMYIDNKINFDIIRFVDETFTACGDGWLRRFVDMYKKNIARPMVIATRPEYVNRAKMEILREADNNIQVTMGIESGSEHIRKDVLNRRMSNETIIDAFSLCHELGFSTAAFNMIGLPGETRKYFFETIELNAATGVHTPMLSYFYPFKGCKLRDECIERGYIDDEMHEVDYSVSSVLNMPGFSGEDIEGLKRTFVMYVKMDKKYYPDIEKAEKDDDVFNKMVGIYNEKYGVGAVKK